MGRRRKHETKVMKTAKVRIAGIQAFDPAFTLGNNKDVTAYESKVNTCQDILDDYNSKLADLDELLNRFIDEENKLRSLNAEMLAGVKAIHGWDSNQYEMAGGVRRSERKKWTRRNTQSESPDLT